MCMEPSLPGGVWKMKLEQKECCIRSDSAATPGRELSLESHKFFKIYCPTFADSGDLGKHSNLHICLDELNCLISEGQWVIPELWEAWV